VWVRAFVQDLPNYACCGLNENELRVLRVKTEETLNIQSIRCIRTLRLKVKPEGYAWLNAAAIETNQVWNYANETSAKAAQPFWGRGKWLSGYDLDKLTAGASRYFDRIGSGTIQRINAEFATRRAQFKKKRLRWRVSFGAKRSLGWVPLKAEQLKRRGKCLRFSGKAFRMFEQARLADVKWKSGCFAQDAVGDWWLCLPVEQVIEQSIAPFGRWALI